MIDSETQRYETQVCYRLYIGAPNDDRNEREYWATLERYLSQNVKAFTLLRGRGYWEGCGENSAVVEIVYSRLQDSPVFVERLAAEIRQQFRQDAILITRQEIGSLLSV